jgi:hypothetical protein
LVHGRGVERQGRGLQCGQWDATLILCIRWSCVLRYLVEYIYFLILSDERTGKYTVEKPYANHIRYHQLPSATVRKTGPLLRFFVGIRWYPTNFRTLHIIGCQRIPSGHFSLGLNAESWLLHILPAPNRPGKGSKRCIKATFAIERTSDSPFQSILLLSSLFKPCSLPSS